MIAARTARPLAPRMSVTTRVSFTFASSSVFCNRRVCRPLSPTRQSVKVMDVLAKLQDAGYQVQP